MSLRDSAAAESWQSTPKILGYGLPRSFHSLAMTKYRISKQILESRQVAKHAFATIESSKSDSQSEAQTLKALSGWGRLKGEGASLPMQWRSHKSTLANSSPSPLAKKEKVRES